MSTHKHFDRICCIILALVLIIALIFINGEAIGIEASARAMGYEAKLFDNTQVHSINIEMEDWEQFLTTCTSEEYAACDITIDGELYKNVAIRGKGNTSLSSVQSYGNDRYSFKVEFDHYDSTKTYHGLDKLCLNNIIQDNTFMKDYLTYTMMNEFGVSAPLCSFVYITVNGEEWGLYLAVEAVEESFLQRNYGNDYGELYKPDSLSFGGGRGNGMDFNMEDFAAEFEDMRAEFEQQRGNSEESGFSFPEDFDMSALQGGFTMPEDFDPSAMFGSTDGTTEMPDGFDLSSLFAGGGKGGMGGFSMGSSDVKLQYIDDDPDSYSNIFDSAKTDVSDADEKRLISSLKTLSEGEDIEACVNIEEVIRYFVVHNFVCNGDSYTGSMIHNYYLYEEEGRLSMLPWDYNLAFGSFSGGMGGSGATDSVNEPIDTPVSGGTGEDRPMISWIFADEEYTELYHTYFEEFITEFYDGGRMTELIDSAAELIAPYVEKDPTKFCTYEEFEAGVAALREFCLLRAESVSGQLDGTIPSTSDGQTDSTALIDASHVDISDMGSMNMGGGGRNSFDRGEMRQGMTEESFDSAQSANTAQSEISLPESGLMPEMGSFPQMGELSAEGGIPEMPDGMTPPDFAGGELPEMPDGTAPSGFGDTEPPSMPQTDTSADSTEQPAVTETAEAQQPESNENSHNGGGSWQGGDKPSRENSWTEQNDGSAAPNGMNTVASQDNSSIILLAISAGVLAAGLIFAKLYK